MAERNTAPDVWTNGAETRYLRLLITDPSMRAILIASVLLHVLAAWFGCGYYHFDEHYQVIEFASFKAGLTSVTDLPWEFAARLRPWFLPSLFYILIEAGYKIGLTNPFLLTFLFRVLACILSLHATFSFYAALVSHQASATTSKLFDPLASHFTRHARIFMFAALNFLWFSPFLHVHASSESVAASFFIWGLAIIIRSQNLPVFRNIDALLVGLLWGLAFESRFQIAFMVAAALAWLCVVRPTTRSKIFLVTAAGLVVFILGRILDSWGYGEWVFTPWNYLRSNLVQNVAAEKFGTEPVWYYLVALAVRFPPISTLLTVLILAALWTFPKRLLSAIVIGMLAPHFMIGHKELRFLFPVASLAIALVAILIFEKKRFQRVLNRKWIVRSFLTLNGFGLVFMTFFMSPREISLWKFVYNLHVPHFAYVAYDGDPFYPAGLKASFYIPNVSRLGITQDGSDWRMLPTTPRAVTYVAAKGRNLLTPSFPPQFDCPLIFDDRPSWPQGGVGKALLARIKFTSIQLYRCQTRPSD